MEYWEKKNKKPKIVVDGHFKGWVNPEYVKKYNLPATEVDLNTKDGECRMSLYYEPRLLIYLKTIKRKRKEAQYVSVRRIGKFL